VAFILFEAKNIRYLFMSSTLHTETCLGQISGLFGNNQNTRNYAYTICGILAAAKIRFEETQVQGLKFRTLIGEPQNLRYFTILGPDEKNPHSLRAASSPADSYNIITDPLAVRRMKTVTDLVAPSDNSAICDIMAGDPKSDITPAEFQIAASKADPMTVAKSLSLRMGSRACLIQDSVAQRQREIQARIQAIAEEVGVAS